MTAPQRNFYLALTNLLRGYHIDDALFAIVEAVRDGEAHHRDPVFDALVGRSTEISDLPRLLNEAIAESERRRENF
jgi:hypothetical protein